MSLAETDKRLLLSLAGAAVRAAAAGRDLPEVPADLPATLTEPRGAFVTLHARGRLRGCIGMLEARGPLAQTVVAMAAAAAVDDPRFRPVTPPEVTDLELEISVLSPLTRVGSADAVRLGTDGVLVRQGHRSGVFLPQVAEETGWSKERFLSELCESKAGLPADAWRKPDCELYTFTVELLNGRLDASGAGDGRG